MWEMSVWKRKLFVRSRVDARTFTLCSYKNIFHYAVCMSCSRPSQILEIKRYNNNETNILLLNPLAHINSYHLCIIGISKYFKKGKFHFQFVLNSEILSRFLINI